ncbi:MAG: protein kinase, partial [Myxococcota bacterium]
LTPQHLWWERGRAWSEVKLALPGFPRQMMPIIRKILGGTSANFSSKYSAPEQILYPGLASIESDLYASGLLLFEMITGQFPLTNMSEKQPWLLQSAHQWGTVPSLRHFLPDADFPEAMENMMQTFLAKSPKQRPKSMKDALSLWQESVVRWRPLEERWFPERVPMELKRRKRPLDFSPHGLRKFRRSTDAWKQLTLQIPGTFLPMVEGWSREEVFQMGAPVVVRRLLGQFPNKFPFPEGAWVSVLATHLQDAAFSPRKVAGRLDKLPDAEQAAQRLDALKKRVSQQQNRVRPAKKPNAALQSVADVPTSQIRIQEVAKQEILSLAELEARLPEMSRMQKESKDEIVRRMLQSFVQDHSDLERSENALGMSLEELQGLEFLPRPPWYQSRWIWSILILMNVALIVMAVYFLYGSAILSFFSSTWMIPSWNLLVGVVWMKWGQFLRIQPSWSIRHPLPVQVKFDSSESRNMQGRAP